MVVVVAVDADCALDRNACDAFRVVKIVPCKHGLEHLVGVSPGGRTVGKLHISDLYNRYHEGLSNAKKYKGETNPLYYEAGLAWELMLERGLKERMAVSRPGELTTPEGIVYSPDLILFEDDHTILGEIKLTWMSCKEMPKSPADSLPSKFDKYLTQMLAYAHNLETPYARLIAFFVNGDYIDRVPQLLAWDFTFTKREMEENWRRLLNVAKAEGML